MIPAAQKATIKADAQTQNKEISFHGSGQLRGSDGSLEGVGTSSIPSLVFQTVPVLVRWISSWLGKFSVWMATTSLSSCKLCNCIVPP